MFTTLTEIVKVAGRMALALFILGVILALLPPIGLPDEVAEAITYFLTILYSFNFVFPIVALISAVSFIYLFDIVVISWHAITWVFNKFKIL